MDAIQIEQLILHIVFYGLLGGVVSLTGNVCMVIGILRSPQLRSRFFVILWFLMAARAAYCLQLLTSGIHRSLRLFGIGNSMKRGTCYLFNLHFYYSGTVELVLLWGIIVDRTIAIVAYNYYRNLTQRQAAESCIIAIVVTSAFKIIPSCLGLDFGGTVPCANAFYPTTTVLYTAYHQNIDLAFSLSILISYGGLISYLKYRLLPAVKEKCKRSGDQSALKTLNRQAKLLPLLRRLVLYHCGTSLIGRGLLAINAYVPQWLAIRFTSYAGSAIGLDLFTNVVILLVSNRDLRKAAFPCCNNQVAPSGANVTAVQTVCPQIIKVKEAVNTP